MPTALVTHNEPVTTEEKSFTVLSYGESYKPYEPRRVRQSSTQNLARSRSSAHTHLRTGPPSGRIVA